MSATPLPPLSLLESRILGVLVEKERTVPDSYPLTSNALVTGCNQKTSRNPVITASEAELQAALDKLRRLALVIESSGGRVMRYEQNIKRVLDVPALAVPLLAMLALRGAQTSAELRANCARIENYADASSVEGFLHELAERPQGALVMLLPRQPGEREARWVHLLGGPVVPEPTVFAPAHRAGEDDASSSPALAVETLAARLARLEEVVEQLQASIAALTAARDES